ncbi:MAG TPA: hypothetical protein PK323_14025 [Bacteroidia bacterium]|nr:hypothetical protein [Bacteroidia bacterium]
MKYKKYLSLFLITISFQFLLVKNVEAQKMFYQGFVVTNNGDTINGKIPYDLATNNNYHIVDLKDDKGFVKKFNVWQIKMYSMNNELYYTKKCERGETKHRNDLVFMHQIQIGKLCLYEYEYVAKIGGARTYEEGGIQVDGEKDYYVEKQDGSFIYFPHLGYKKVLKDLISEQSECLALIETKDIEYKKIPEVIACFNAK